MAMAPPAPASAPAAAPYIAVSGKRRPNANLFDRIRELRAEVQDLQGVLMSVRNGQATLTDVVPYITKTKADIAALMDDIKGGDNADSVRRIHNAWELMSVSPIIDEPGGTYDAQTLVNHLNMLDAQARSLIFEAGVLTIPPRLQDWLDMSRPGHYL